MLIQRYTLGGCIFDVLIQNTKGSNIMKEKIFTVPDGTTEIKRGMIPRDATVVVIPEGVTSIGDEAFYDCEALKSITIPEGVTEIGKCVFYGCKVLTSVIIPEGVTSIGESAFWGCKALKSITIPEGVTSIGESAFWGCTSLN